MIEREWREFCLVCFGDVSEQQYTDLRRTFYGGAAALFKVIMTMLEPGEEPTAADLVKMSELHQELADFSDDVKTGRA